jgi:hypothetical protein
MSTVHSKGSLAWAEVGWYGPIRLAVAGREDRAVPKTAVVWKCFLWMTINPKGTATSWNKRNKSLKVRLHVRFRNAFCSLRFVHCVFLRFCVYKEYLDKCCHKQTWSAMRFKEAMDARLCLKNVPQNRACKCTLLSANERQRQMER